MTVGVFLDRAATGLALAESRLKNTIPRAYDAAATMTARDELYRQLGRLIHHALGGDAPAETKQTLDDFISLLGSDAGSPFQLTDLLSKGVAAATLGLPRVPTDLLRAPGTAAEALIEAADGVAFAAETIATHRNPNSGPVPWGRRVGPRYLTKEGHALANDAARRESTAEVARLVLSAMRIDGQLEAWQQQQPDALSAQHWRALNLWAHSSFPDALGSIANSGPANQLRQLDVAPADRSFNPAPIQSWADVIAVVRAARSTLRRDYDVGTIALAAAAARIGFAATAATWRFTSTGTPDERTALQGDRWRALSNALQYVADIRDELARPLVAELDRARKWIRDTVVQRTTLATPSELRQTLQLEREVSLLCRDLSDPIRHALVGRKLMTVSYTMDRQPTSGFVLAVAKWTQPQRADAAVSRVQQALLAVEGFAPSWNMRTTLSKLMAAADRLVKKTRSRRTPRARTGSPDAAGTRSAELVGNHPEREPGKAPTKSAKCRSRLRRTQANPPHTLRRL